MHFEDSVSFMQEKVPAVSDFWKLCLTSASTPLSQHSYNTQRGYSKHRPSAANVKAELSAMVMRWRSVGMKTRLTEVFRDTSKQASIAQKTEAITDNVRDMRVIIVVIVTLYALAKHRYPCIVRKPTPGPSSLHRRRQRLPHRRGFAAEVDSNRSPRPVGGGGSLCALGPPSSGRTTRAEDMRRRQGEARAEGPFPEMMLWLRRGHEAGEGVRPGARGAAEEVTVAPIHPSIHISAIFDFNVLLLTHSFFLPSFLQKQKRLFQTYHWKW